MRKILVGLLAVVGASCDCGQGTKKNAPVLEVLTDDGADMRTSVDFGFVQVNIKGTQKVRVRNSGTALLSISEAAFTSSSGKMPVEFTVDSPLPFEVAAGAEEQLTLAFTPTVADQRITGQVTLTSNDQAHATYSMMLAGQGVTAVARATPTMLAFGDVYVNESKTLMLTLTNAGGSALPVTGASITGSPLDVSGDFTSFTNVMIPSGGSATVPVTFAPMAPHLGPVSGAVVIHLDPASGSDVTVPLTGRATEALPRMCFKFDDTGLETCTDQITTSLNIVFGPQCDNEHYTCAGTTAQRSGKLYLKNEGNVRVAYNVVYTPFVDQGVRCSPDAGSLADFTFSNVPTDGGVPSPLTQPTTLLPMSEADPMPWQTTPIDITYRARSRCPGEGADQASVLWSRQCPSPPDPKDPSCTVNRRPFNLYATITGTSLLPLAKPVPFNLGQEMQPADVPLTTPVSVELVSNVGVGKLTVTSVELWEELIPAYLPDGGTYDAGGPLGGLLSPCNPANEFSDCARFQWAPGQSPTTYTPVTLDGGTTGAPTKTILGKLFAGCLADGGSCPAATTKYRILAIVNTSDPYNPRVAVPITVYAKFLP